MRRSPGSVTRHTRPAEAATKASSTTTCGGSPGAAGKHAAAGHPGRTTEGRLRADTNCLPPRPNTKVIYHLSRARVRISYWCEHSKEPLRSALNPLTEATTSNIVAPRPPLHTHHELDGWRGSIFWISRRKRLFRALTSSGKSRLPHPYETLFCRASISASHRL